MKEFLLRSFLADKKLYIIDQQRVERAIKLLKFIDRVVLQALNHIGNEAFRMHIGNVGFGVMLQQAIAGCLHQVCLAQANPAVNKKRVVGATRVFADLHRGGPGQLIGFTFYVGFEGEFRVKSNGGAFCLVRHPADRSAAPADAGNFLPFLAADFNGDGYFPALAVLTDYLGDALEETFLDPIHHEPVRRKEAQVVSLVYRLQRLNPGAELLRGQLAFELFNALLPDRGIAHVNSFG